MRNLSLAETKAHLSAIVDCVEAGEEVVITRRGRPVARIVPEHELKLADARRWVDELSAFVTAQPLRAGSSVEAVREQRDGARYG
jgi:prevent-host-death family protein